MNNKGQALIEFVMVLPIALLLIFGSIDIIRIFYEKSNLENATNDVISMLEEKHNTYDNVNEYIKNKYKDTTLSFKYRTDGYLEISLIKNVRIFTPGLNLILGNPYKAKTTRVVKYE